MMKKFNRVKNISYIMDESNNLLASLAYHCGKLSAQAATNTHQEVIINAEWEEDLLEIMAELWAEINQKYESYLSVGESPNFDVLKKFRNLWGDGFLDEVFPLRAFA